MITDTKALLEFCQRISSSEYITVDTEFMREKTYWPILCLVQIAGKNEADCIDALASGIDLGPLFDLMADKNVLKVFHAARQDLEIFFHKTGVVPHPVFDTQVAAMVCGFGDSVGYESLIAELVKEPVDKGSRYTDWTVRPLTKRQIDYALADVTHLRPAYEKLLKILNLNKREIWLEEEMAILESTETYNGNPREAFRRIKARNTSPKMLAVLRELACWRETEAQNKNVPRNRILRDEQLTEIAHHTPESVDQLARTRGLGNRIAHGEYGKKILYAIKTAQKIKECDCPKPKLKAKLPRGLGPVIELLKVLLKMKSENSDVATKLLASASDIEQIAALGDAAKVKALIGWRREVFGNDALKLRAGDLSITIKEKKLVLTQSKNS
ncbi:MAG: ribonuclease D [Pseudomonadota bacterium]|nr:ribonuclease D [Pseudomonadota bacterium]